MRTNRNLEPVFETGGLHPKSGSSGSCIYIKKIKINKYLQKKCFAFVLPDTVNSIIQRSITKVIIYEPSVMERGPAFYFQGVILSPVQSIWVPT